MGCGAYHTIALAGYPIESIDQVRMAFLLGEIEILLGEAGG